MASNRDTDRVRNGLLDFIGKLGYEELEMLSLLVNERLNSRPLSPAQRADPYDVCTTSEYRA